MTKRAEASTYHDSVIRLVFIPTHFTQRSDWVIRHDGLSSVQKLIIMVLTHSTDFFLKDENRRHVFIWFIDGWFSEMTCVSKYDIVHFIQLMMQLMIAHLCVWNCTSNRHESLSIRKSCSMSLPCVVSYSSGLHDRHTTTSLRSRLFFADLNKTANPGMCESLP